MQINRFLFSLILTCFSCLAAIAADGVRDLVIVLPNCPLHVRVWAKESDLSVEQRRADYVHDLVVRLDVNKDGKITPDETRTHPLFTTSRRLDDNPFIKKLDQNRTITIADIELAVQRAGGQSMSYRQDNSLADNDLGVFKVLDTDGSGIIEAKEMRMAASRIATRDSDFDRVITVDEFLDRPTAVDPAAQAVAANDEPLPTVHSDLLRDFREPTLPIRLIRTYDKDRNARLSASELGWTAKRLSALDTNADGQLTVRELESLPNQPADIELSVDLAMPADTALKIISKRDETELSGPRNGSYRMQCGDITVGLVFRKSDPISEAENAAKNAFNKIDTDANGYLDRSEIQEHHRFRRYLFDAMDQDKDDRLFAKEMSDYVRTFTEPAASSCQLTLFDVGSGYFQILDPSDDGRISIRELRQVEQKLSEVAGGSGVGLNPSKVRHSYRIEFSRGMASLFDSGELPVTERQVPILRESTGPIWFQRMDRNSDGDLSWEEFLGPREAFHELDTDGDGLIDASEASKKREKT